METPSHLDGPAHWRRRAEEARRMAQYFSDPKANRTMLDIAAAYERLAELLEAKQTAKPSAS